ncbi:hypothetical protein [Actinomyces capricornis]|uniref:hypothetical protein n=1 Tax=Actinomyces capricornis TaxID=2755559 RepID=UPI001CC5F477|nr:hypothetical protein [Actinomyces capricornis]
MSTRIEKSSACRRKNSLLAFFAFFLPIVGIAGAVLIRLIDPPINPISLAASNVACILVGLFSGLQCWHFGRTASYEVTSPELMKGDASVIIVADTETDPLLTSIAARLFWGSSAFFFFFLSCTAYQPPGEEIPSLVILAVLALLGAFFFGWAGYYGVVRSKRKRHPGSIEMNGWGLRQRVGDRVVEVAWKDISAFKSVDRNDRGEIVGSWIADSEQKISYRASRRPKPYRQRRAQPLFLLLTPVGNIMNFANFLRDAQNDPAWAAEIFNSPHRLEWIHSILTAHEPGLEISGDPTTMSDGGGGYGHLRRQLLGDPRYPGPGQCFSVSAGGM